MNGLSVLAYSRERDGARKLTAHFKVKEFACRDGSDPIFIADGLPQLLEQIRCEIGEPVVINSSYRTPSYNKKVGGASRSRHLYGGAADIHAGGVDPMKLARIAERLLGSRGGIGLYTWGIHVDLREKRYRWDQRGGKEQPVSGF